MSFTLDSFSSALENFVVLFSSNPSVFFFQVFITVAGCIGVFFVLFTTRDVFLRSKSFLYQVFAIILVAGLPFLGFFLYILIRPSQTLAQRRLTKTVDAILTKLQQAQVQHVQHQQKKNSHPQKKGK